MLYLNIEQLLQENLPHGSGIDCDWKVQILKNGTIKCFNSFTCYSDGMIDGYQDFYVVIKLGGDNINNTIGIYLEKICFTNSRYLAEKYDLKPYLEDLFFDVGVLESAVYNGFNLHRYIG